MSFTPYTIDPKLDLVLEREVDVPPELVWKAWTTPELLKQWFTPKPYETPECEIDLRPGGAFRTVMRSPEGDEFDNTGCYLEIVPEEKLSWTSALGPDFRPKGVGSDDLPMTAIDRAAAERQVVARATAPWPSTSTRQAASDTRRWASRTAGEPPSISSSS